MDRQHVVSSGDDVGVSLRTLSPLPPELIPQLHELYQREWWTRARTEDDVHRMLDGASITYGLIDEQIGELVGFTRVLSDGVYLALILDVIVRHEDRAKGSGRHLLDAVLADPRVRDVRSLELVCQPDLVGFYEQWGFTDRVGHSRLMRRSQ